MLSKLSSVMIFILASQIHIYPPCLFVCLACRHQEKTLVFRDCEIFANLRFKLKLASGGVNSEDWEARASTKTVSINLANYKPSDKKYL